MLHAFEYFGEVPRELLTDNMKTVVADREAGNVIWNTQFSDFSVERGIPKGCRVRAPQTKGKVERLVRYVKENFFPGRSFVDLEDLNRLSDGAALVRMGVPIDSFVLGAENHKSLFASDLNNLQQIVVFVWCQAASQSLV